MDQLAACVVAVVLVDGFLAPREPDPASTGWRSPPLSAALVLVLSVPLARLAETTLLAPATLLDLRLPLLVLATAAVGGLCTVVLGLTQAPRVLLDATLLAVALLATGRGAGLAGALAWAAGTGVSFVVCTVLFTELRERLELGEAPAPLRGAALLLVSAGLFAIGLGGLATVLRG
jgi:electron transport complex protein RnfA